MLCSNVQAVVARRRLQWLAATSSNRLGRWTFTARDEERSVATCPSSEGSSSKAKTRGGTGSAVQTRPCFLFVRSKLTKNLSFQVVESSTLREEERRTKIDISQPRHPCSFHMPALPLLISGETVPSASQPDTALPCPAKLQKISGYLY